MSCGGGQLGIKLAHLYFIPYLHVYYYVHVVGNPLLYLDKLILNLLKVSVMIFFVLRVMDSTFLASWLRLIDWLIFGV
jgi:hypothetical protein